jgi:Txe/YoeB family toxin of toxin-antitoxin system
VNQPYELRFTKEAKKDIDKLSEERKQKLKKILISQIALTPHSGKKLTGDLMGFFSVRLNHKDRVIYSIDEENHCVNIHRTRTHYGE